MWVDLTELKNNTAQGEAPQKGSRNVAGSATLQQRYGQDRTCFQSQAILSCHSGVHMPRHHAGRDVQTEKWEMDREET